MVAAQWTCSRLAVDVALSLDCPPPASLWDGGGYTCTDFARPRIIPKRRPTSRGLHECKQIRRGNRDLSSTFLNRTIAGGMDKVRFEAELIEGHKGVTVVLVPFDPEEKWSQSPSVSTCAAMVGL